MSTTMQCSLAEKKCKPCEGGVAPLTSEEIQINLKNLNQWEYRDGKISKTFTFKNYYQTIAFVNAIAWMAHTENHHPELFVTYNTCTVTYSTHAIDSLSENDFICAAKIDALLEA